MSAESPTSPTSSSSSLMMSTNTLLAVPDGPISSSSSDLHSHTASYIGGYPTFPSFPSTSISPPSVVNCGACHLPIPLLTQVYCPPEGGENDRTIYVFGCPRASCSRRDASIRAFRVSVRNEEYVRDVIEHRMKREAEEAAEKEREKERAKINPFSMGAIASEPHGSSLFGAAVPFGGAFGGASFGGDSSLNPFASSASQKPEPAIEESLSALSVSEPTPASASASASDPSTPSITFTPPLPAYQPPQYLSTFDEFIPDHSKAAKIADHDDRNDVGGGEKAGRKASAAEDAKQNGAGGAEQWERVLPKGVDEVFERFVNRLNEAEGGEDQVLRYDLGATPLPYSSHSTLYRKLFPKTSRTSAPSQRITATTTSEDPDSDDEEASDLAGRYHPDGVVPSCSLCGAERVFEMQLVPGLISALKPELLTTSGAKRSKKSKKKKSAAATQTAEERKKEIAAMLSGGSTEGEEGEGDGLGQVAEAGMEWGTVMVFGCRNDCVGFGEEWVGVEWEEAIM